MRSRLRKPAVVAAIALCALTSGAVASAGATGGATGGARSAVSATSLLGGFNTDGFGVGSSPAAADRTIATALALHAKVVRLELQWSVLEPRAAGQIEPGALAYIDRFMSDAKAHGIGVIALVDSTPCWASSAPERLLRACIPGQHNEANDWQPANPADFATLVHTLSERYRDSITALEVWNEPDQANEKYFAGPEKAAHYAALLAAGYAAVKQVDPNIKVLGGSLVGANGRFLELLYKDGIKGHYDGLAVHFYTLSLASVRGIHAVQVANGDATPLWLDEFGWGNCYPRERSQEEQACVTSAIQALNLTNIYRALASAPYVAAATMYELQDGGGDSFGLITRRGARKPAYSALAKVLASPLGAQSPVTLALRRTHGHLLASGSAPVGDFMQLEAFKGKLLRYRATFTLDRFNRYSLALPRALGTRGLRVRVYQFWTGLSRAAQKRV